VRKRDLVADLCGFIVHRKSTGGHFEFWLLAHFPQTFARCVLSQIEKHLPIVEKQLSKLKSVKMVTGPSFAPLLLMCIIMNSA